MHSAEQAASSLLYLKELGAMMARPAAHRAALPRCHAPPRRVKRWSQARTNRGVLRSEVCSSLLESLTRLMTPPVAARRQGSRAGKSSRERGILLCHIARIEGVG